MHHERRAEPCGKITLLLGLAERFHRSLIVGRPSEDEGLAMRLEGMDIEQDVVLSQQRANSVADSVFIILRHDPLA